jgi:hypothetical protein
MGPTRIKLIKEVLSQRCGWSDLGLIVRFLYTLKVFLCIILGRQYCHLDRDQVVTGVAKFDHQQITWHPDPNVLLWTEVAVGTGLFKNWFYEIYSDSTPDGDIGNKGEIGVLYIPLGRL